jgi:[protein-PII] uridylyltransferase
MAELARSFDQFWLLYIGALFHDIAKGRGGRHEEKGVKDAELFCTQHGVESQDADLVKFLVLRHLEMSRVSQKSDIQDPEVIEAFAALCGSVRYLDALYLLTVADMRATGPTVWSDWKARLLESLWRKTKKVLDGNGACPGGKGDELRRLVYTEGLKLGASPDQIKAYVDALDDVYFLRSSPEDCQWHARALIKAPRSETVCCVEYDEVGGLKCLVWSQDRRGLFLRICAALAKKGLSVRSAKLASSKSGWALDGFEAFEPLGADCSAARADEIRTAILWELEHPELSKGASLGRTSERARQAGAVAQAHISKAGEDWLMEVACADRSGVLWTIAEQLDRCAIGVKSARVTTVGERAEDVFVVSSPDLSSADFRLSLESNLVKRLGFL